MAQQPKPRGLNSRTLILFFLVTALESFALPAHAAQCKTSSGPNKAALIELYTSEGCSSCPPADNWLRKVPGEDYASGKIVPLSFHVDYWDYIGWVDRFAKKQHTQRQRKVASVNGLNTIYTPQVVVGGRDFRFWYWNGRTESKISAITNMPAQAKIDLVVKKSEGRKLMALSNIMLKPHRHPRQSSIFMVLYQNNLSSRVKAGENNGRELKHDFVVRDLRGPFDLTAASMKKIEQDFYLDKSWNPADIGVAVFVQDKNSGEVLQALSSANCS